MTQDELFKKLVAHCKEYGFIFPSSEIYDGLGAVYDYGQNGVELKNNIKRYWWDSMVKLHENIVGLDAAIFMHPRTWEASGHVGAFNDPLIDNRDSKKRYRADVLIEDWLAKQDEKISKEVEKARKRFGEAFDEEQYRATSPRVADIAAKRDAVHERFAEALNANDLNELRQIILDCEIVCPISGTRNWTEVRQFNLMFSTQMGSTADGASTIYLRPETAQGIFVNFLNVQKTGRMKLPFGIAQIGKAFRNEIVARQFIFRMREFEQMEMQFFVRPGDEMNWWQQWKQTRMAWHRALGFGHDNYRFHDHDKLAHNYDGVALTGIYNWRCCEWNWTPRTCTWHLNAGVGAALGMYNFDNAGFLIGVAGSCAFGCLFKSVPISIDVDYRPVIGAVAGGGDKGFFTPGFWNFGLAVAYHF